MFYHLVNENDVTVDIAEYPEKLNYSRLHHSTKWSVWVYWDDHSARMKIADVDWSGNSGYVFYDPYAKERLFIRNHAHIVPMVSGSIFYHGMFHRYSTPEVARLLRVFPGGD